MTIGQAADLMKGVQRIDASLEQIAKVLTEQTKIGGSLDVAGAVYRAGVRELATRP